MASSRLNYVGTVFSRISGLLKSGAMKPEDRPLWYDVYRAFPPKYEPVMGRTVELTPIKNIFYPEDSIRALVHKKVKRLPADDWFKPEKTDITKEAILLTQSVMEKNPALSIEDAVNDALKRLPITEYGSKTQKRTVSSEKSSESQKTAKAFEEVSQHPARKVKESMTDTLEGTQHTDSEWSSLKEVTDQNVDVKSNVSNYKEEV